MSRNAHLCLATAWMGGLSLTACTLLNAEHPAAGKPHRAEVVPAALHISQVDFGRDARSTRCTEPPCPSVTPKTLSAPAAPIGRPPFVATQPTARAAATPRSGALAAVELPTDPRPATPQKLTLHFGTNSAVLTATHKALLSNAISELQRTDRIVIAGRTDDLGSGSLNEALALARALAIRDHLLNLAPDLPARIAIDAKGRCCYATPNDSSAGRAQNRRVELAYTPRDEGAP